MCRKMTINLTPTPNFAQFLFELLTFNGTKCIEGTIDGFLFVRNFFGTKPGHHAVTSFTKPGPAILT
jgi:hypothetical protein